ncbi:MAG TPA: hypothetical protein VM686_05150 [Polyangiaceae bacterium]|nr:hypothetical protein [Polyangiaceae bacterium]
MVKRTWLVLVPLMAACSGESASDPAASAGSVGAVAGGGSGGSGGGGTGGTGGSAGGTAGSGAGSAGAAAPDCSGAFGTPVNRLSVPAPALLASPSIGPGELELFYVQYDTEVGPITFRRSVRASRDAEFPPGEVVSELDAACEPGHERMLDLTQDGLRAYLVCFAPGSLTYEGPLRVARRESLAGPFVLDADEYGYVGPSPSISSDELSLYTSAEDSEGAWLMVSLRDSSMSSFDPNDVISELSSEALTSPDIGPDQRALFAGHWDGGIARATRADASSPFGHSEIVVPPVKGTSYDDGVFFGAPDASGDCRTLYAVSIDQAADVYSIAEIRR